MITHPMKSDHSQETVLELAFRFSAIIRAWLSPEELAAVRIHPAHDQCCLTHDYCDPNQAMLYAWQGCFGRGDVPAFICGDETDPIVLRDEQTVNQAWRIAREKGFK